MINIHPETDDPFYRYKMPKLLAKIEGSGNGIKTVVVNMSAIAKALNRAPEYTTKFFGCELGAQVQMNAREDRWIVNGAHDGDKLQSLLGSFVKKFVLCVNCENPETVLSVSKSGDISQKCQACGHVGTVPIGHRLSNYITSHPPNSLNGSGVSGGKKRKGNKNVVVEKPVASTIESELTVAVDAPPQILAEDDRTWTGEADISGELEGLSLEDTKKSAHVRADIFFRFVKANPGATEEIFAEAERLDMLDKAPLIILEILITTNTELKELIGQNAQLFARFCIGNDRAQKYLIAGIEQAIAFNPALVKQTPFVLMELYEHDLVSEDTFKAWSQKASKKYLKSKELTKQVHSAASPFMEWLNEADEEEEEEAPQNERDDKFEVVFSFRNEADIANKKKTAEKHDEDDELDIDAI